MENPNDKAPETNSTTTELLARSAALKKKNHDTLEQLKALQAQTQAFLNPNTQQEPKP
jgi:uncharacterized coiled-coil DUF342 family protein